MSSDEQLLADLRARLDARDQAPANLEDDLRRRLLRRLEQRAARGERLTPEEQQDLTRAGVIVPGTPQERVWRSWVGRTLMPALFGAVRGVSWGLVQPQMPRVAGEQRPIEPTRAGAILGGVAEFVGGIPSPIGIGAARLAQPLARVLSQAVRPALQGVVRAGAEAGQMGLMFGLARVATDPKEHETVRRLYQQSPERAAAYVLRQAGETGVTWGAMGTGLAVGAQAVQHVLRRVRPPRAAPTVVTDTEVVRGTPGQPTVEQPGTATRPLVEAILDAHEGVAAVYGRRVRRPAEAYPKPAPRPAQEFHTGVEAIYGRRVRLPSEAAPQPRSRLARGPEGEPLAPTAIEQLLADQLELAARVVDAATPQQLVALAFIKKATPEQLSRILQGTRATGTNPRALGLNPRNIAKVAAEFDISLQEARDLIMARIVEDAAKRSGKSIADFIRDESGQVTIGLLTPEMRVVKGHLGQLRREPGVSPIEAIAAVIMHEVPTNKREWVRRLRASVPKEAWDELKGRVDELYDSTRATYAKLAGRVVDAVGQLPPLQRVLELYNKGAGGHEWYESSRKVVMAGLGEELGDLFLKFLAATSGQTSVSANVGKARKALMQYLSGQPFSGFSKDEIDKLTRLARGEDPREVLGRKTWNFYRALRGDPDAVVVDMHMMRAFGFDPRRAPTDQEYDFIEAAVRRWAAELGVTPRDFQARIWVGVRSELGHIRDANESFASILSARPGLFEQAKVIAGKSKLPERWSTEEGLRRAVLEDEWVIITAENPRHPVQAGAIRPGEPANHALVRHLIDRYGLTADQIIPVRGWYEGQWENSYLVFGLNVKDALRVANRFGQEAIASRHGLVYTRTGAVDPAVGVFVGEEAKRQVGGTLLPNGLAFSLDLDFSSQVSVKDVVRGLVKSAQMTLFGDQRGELRLTWNPQRGTYEAPPNAPPGVQAVVEAANEARRTYSVRHTLQHGKPPADVPPAKVTITDDGGWTLGGIVEALEEVTTAIRLTSPLTHIRNTVANTYSLLIRPLEAEVAGQLARVTGGPRVPGEGKQVLFGYAAALPEATANLVRALRNEFNIAGMRANEEMLMRVAGKAIERPGSIPGTAGILVRAPFRWLGIADEFVKELHRRASIYQAAYRTAVKEGKRGEALVERVAELTRNPTDEIRQWAEKKAREFTFTEELGQFGRFLLMAREMVPGARILLPFVVTPTNVMKFFARRTPLGVATAFRVEGRRILPREGGQFEEALARALIGSAVSATAVWLAATGRVTGAGPENQNMRRTLYASGWQPYSILVGDRWVSYRGIEPLATFLSTAATAVETLRDRDDETGSSVAARLTAMAMKSLLEPTFANQLANVLDAIENPSAHLGRYISDQVGSALVPAVVSAVARTADPTVRDPQTFVERLMVRVPGLRQKVPAKLDVFGREVQTGGVALFTPPISQVSSDPLIHELVRLGVSLPQVAKVRVVQGEKVRRTPEEVRELTRRRGELYLDLLTRLVNSEAYQRLDDEQRRVVLRRWISRIVEMVQETEGGR